MLSLDPSSPDAPALRAAPKDRARPRAARALLGALLVLALATAVQQLFSGRPLFGRSLFVFPAAILAALAWLGLEVAGGRRRPPVLAACASAVLYLSNLGWLGTADSAAARLLPFAILRHGTLSLDPVAPPRPFPYWVGERNGRLWSEYPVAASVLALPVYLPVALGTRTPGGVDAEKLSATVIAAISVGLLLAALGRLGCPRGFSFFATALYAAASSMLSIASQALWQHGPGAMALAGMIWALADPKEARRSQAAAGLFAGLAVAARATNAAVVAPVFAVLLWRSPRRALWRFAAGALGPIGLVAAYNAYAFGAPWRTGYNLVMNLSTEWTSPQLFELFLSPARGLLLYTPWVAFSFAGFALARKNGLFLSFAMGAAAGVLVASAWRPWHGGWCYGPRLLTDLMPLFAVGLAPLARVRAPGLRAGIAVAGAAAALLHGLYVFHPSSETVRHVLEPDEHQMMEWKRYPAAALLRLIRVDLFSMRKP